MIKPIKSFILTAGLSALAALSAFGQNRQDSLTVSEQLIPIDTLYGMKGPVEKDGIMSISYDRWQDPHNTYEDYLTIKGKDGFRGLKDGVFGRDDIISFIYIQIDKKTEKSTVTRGMATENGFDIVSGPADDPTKRVHSHVRELRDLKLFNTVLPHFDVALKLQPK